LLGFREKKEPFFRVGTYSVLKNKIKIYALFSLEVSVFSLEKFYCEKCRVLYDEEENCRVCGSLANKKIYIEVQNQSDKK
jgi:hypothetical protein